MAAVAADTASPDTRLSDDMNHINPAKIDVLNQLMLGGLATGRVGSPLYCRLRYFDPNVGGGRTQLRLTYSDNSDGFLKQLGVNKFRQFFQALYYPWPGAASQVGIDLIYSALQSGLYLSQGSSTILNRIMKQGSHQRNGIKLKPGQG